MAEKSTTKQRGRGKPFQPGQSGNPKGKPKGCLNHATRAALELLDGQVEALTQAAVQKALQGDVAALRLCLERLIPVRKDSPVSFALPGITTAADLPAATGAILDAAAKGELTPAEAQALAGLVEAHRRALETTELEARVAKLEGRSQ